MEESVNLSFLIFSDCSNQWEVFQTNSNPKIKVVGEDNSKEVLVDSNKVVGIANLLIISHQIGISQIMEIKVIGEVNKVDLEIKVQDQVSVTEKS